MNFLDTLDVTAEQIEKPPLMPQGPYIWVVHKAPDINDDKDDWTIVEYQARCVGASEALDPDLVNEFVSRAGELKNQFNRVSFLFSKTDAGQAAKTDYQHRLWLENTLKCWLPGETKKQAMAKAVNCKFIGEVKWVPDKNTPDLYHTNIGRTAPVE